MRVALDWLVTIAVAVAFVLVFEAEVAKPFRVPTASMEPTLRCARPEPGCTSSSSDRVFALRIVYRFRDPHRGEIVVFRTPPLAAAKCGRGGVYVKRLIGLPGEVWEERAGVDYINGKRLNEPYVPAGARDMRTYPPRRIPAGMYFMQGDNRSDSCDSRDWGPVPRANLIGPADVTYWPPTRLAVR